jgi:two-component system, chemotaxis family, chemotaxis protein CheY
MKRCLIVDTSSVIRKVAKHILLSNGLQVGEATSGYEALMACEHEMPDLVIVDATLPDMTTPAFVRELTAIRAEGAPKILICLTEMDIGAIMRAKRAGAAGYLLKPFDRPQLQARIRAVLDLAPATAAA